MRALILTICLLVSFVALSFVDGLVHNIRSKATTRPLTLSSQLEVPTRGILPFLQDDHEISRTESVPIVEPSFTQPTSWKMWATRILLWFQPPWRKVPGRTILKIKLGGILSIEPPNPSFSFGRPTNYESIDSLYDLSMMLMLGAYDPRVKALVIDLRPLNCGYAKLKEARRMLDLFRSSGKQVIGYAEVASEKEVYLAMGFTEFYIPPEGTLDLRGFSASATFLRGAFEKVGIEPQVQRIGKYKSFGDTFNRTSIADPQREVVSALLSQASAYWAEDVARKTNRTVQEVAQLWSAEKALSLADYQQRGLITGVRYWDQVEEMVQDRLRRPGWLFLTLRALVSLLRRMLGKPVIPPVSLVDKHREDADVASLEEEFERYPRRQLPTSLPAAGEHSTSVPPNTTSDTPPELMDPVSAQAVWERDARVKREKALQVMRRMFRTPVLAGGLYQRKMRNGYRILPDLPVREVTRGRRIAIINAAGAIGSGESSRGGLLGASVGADTLIAQLRRARDSSGIKAVVLRVDSPGGSALASDILWREIRLLSRVKPVVASQVDVAASGGYYLSMACDQIVAEELTLTGSIGVVAAKFNAEKLLNEKLGINTDTISIGRFAEVLSTSRGFTEEEEAYFASLARRSYDAFVAKAAASRGMSFADMEQVAQGRVWTGQQAHRRGLVDHHGGVYRALQVAEALSTPRNISSRPGSIRVQTLRETRSVLSPLSLLASARAVLVGRGRRGAEAAAAPLALCEESALPSSLLGADMRGILRDVAAKIFPGRL